jgi:hypothetical protein
MDTAVNYLTRSLRYLSLIPSITKDRETKSAYGMIRWRNAFLRNVDNQLEDLMASQPRRPHGITTQKTTRHQNPEDHTA